MPIRSPLFFLLLVFFMLKSQLIFADEKLILKEAGFEKDSLSWQKSGNAASIGRFSWRFHEGGSAFGVGNDKGAADAWGETHQDIQLGDAVTGGEVFTFTMWVHSEPNYSGRADLKLEFLDSQGQPLGAYQSGVLKGAFDWRKERISERIPEGAKVARVICRSENMAPGNGLSFVWFDEGNVEVVNAKASSSLDGKLTPENVLTNKGAWHSGHSDDQWFEIDFREAREVSGLSIRWGGDYARIYEIAVTKDGKEWETVYTETQGRGGEETVYFENRRISSVKVTCKKSAAGKGYEMEGVEIKKPEENLTLKDYYKIAARDFPSYYPRWMTEKQAYWTIVGGPADEKESLLCEDGSVEPHKKNFCIMPFLFLDGKIVTRDDAEITQYLEKGYLPLPSVQWDYKDLVMNLKLFTYGAPQKTVTYAWYSIKNNNKAEINGRLYLAIRPFMIYPPWQGGVDGFAPINAIRYENSTVVINDKYKITSLVKPDNFGAEKGKLVLPIKFPSAELKADIVSRIKDGQLPETKSIESPEGFASAALEYGFDLKPGASEDFFIAMPLYEKAPDIGMNANREQIAAKFKKMIEENITFWESKVNKVEIDIPEKDIIATLKSNIAYSLITKDGPAFQPGSWSYDKAWMRDGGIACSSMMKVGLLSEAKEFIDWYVKYQYANGMVPPIIDTKAANPLWEEQEKGLIEYDSQGEFIWIILQYYNFTKDKGWLESKLPNVLGALDYLVYLRNQTVTPEFADKASDKKKFYGILPPSQSHEGYWREYSYWDDLWALKGWKDARTIAMILERPDLVNWIDKEYFDLQKCFYDSMALTIKWKALDYIPASASLGDFDPTSTAIAVTYCEEFGNFPQPQLKNSFDRYYNELNNRFNPGAEYRFTPYEMRSAPAFLYMGQKGRSLELLRFMLKCRRPLAWNHLAEVVHSDYRFPTYIGDMPHTWVGAEYINAVRSLFVYEMDGRLILGHGIDEAWLSGENGISVKNMPTYYGEISYTVKKEAEALKIKVWGGKTSTPSNGFVFKLPVDEGIKEVKLNGKALKGFPDNEVVFYKLPCEIDVDFQDKQK